MRRIQHEENTFQCGGQQTPSNQVIQENITTNTHECLDMMLLKGCDIIFVDILAKNA